MSFFGRDSPEEEITVNPTAVPVPTASPPSSPTRVSSPTAPVPVPVPASPSSPVGLGSLPPEPSYRGQDEVIDLGGSIRPLPVTLPPEQSANNDTSTFSDEPDESGRVANFFVQTYALSRKNALLLWSGKLRLLLLLILPLLGSILGFAIDSVIRDEIADFYMDDTTSSNISSNSSRLNVSSGLFGSLINVTLTDVGLSNLALTLASSKARRNGVAS